MELLPSSDQLKLIEEDYPPTPTHSFPEETEVNAVDFTDPNPKED